MKVKDLINILKEYDEDIIVTVRQYDGCYDVERPVVGATLIEDPVPENHPYKEEIKGMYIELEGQDIYG